MPKLSNRKKEDVVLKSEVLVDSSKNLENEKIIISDDGGTWFEDHTDNVVRYDKCGTNRYIFNVPRHYSEWHAVYIDGLIAVVGENDITFIAPEDTITTEIN